MSRGTLTKVVGACCGLAAFAVAIVVGLAADNPGEVILVRALVCMVGCQIVGVGLGLIVERVITDSIELHKRSSPDISESESTRGTPPTGAAAS